VSFFSLSDYFLYHLLYIYITVRYSSLSFTARERFQKTLDDIADQNNIARSPRIDRQRPTPHKEVTDDDVNSLLQRLDHLGTSSSSTSSNLFSPMVTAPKPTANVLLRGSGQDSATFHNTAAVSTTSLTMAGGDAVRHHAQAVPIDRTPPPAPMTTRTTTTTTTTMTNAKTEHDHSWMLAKVGSVASGGQVHTNLQSFSPTPKREDAGGNHDLEQERDWLQREIAREEERMRRLKAKRAGVVVVEGEPATVSPLVSSSGDPNEANPIENQTDDFLKRWRARDIENELSLSYEGHEDQGKEASGIFTRSPTQSGWGNSLHGQSSSPRSERSSEVLRKAEAAMARAEQAMLSFNDRGLDGEGSSDGETKDSGNGDDNDEEQHEVTATEEANMMGLEEVDLAGRYLEMSARDRSLYKDEFLEDERDKAWEYYEDGDEYYQDYDDEDGNYDEDGYYERDGPMPIPRRQRTSSPRKKITKRRISPTKQTLRTSRSLFAERTAGRSVTNNSLNKTSRKAKDQQSHRAQRSLFAKQKQPTSFSELDPRDEIIASLEKTQELQRLKLEAITAERRMQKQQGQRRRRRNDEEKSTSPRNGNLRRKRYPRRRHPSRRDVDEEEYWDDEDEEEEEDYGADLSPRRHRRRRRRRQRREKSDEQDDEYEQDEQDERVELKMQSKKMSMNISRKESIGGYKTLDQYLKHVDTKRSEDVKESTPVGPSNTSSSISSLLHRPPPKRSTEAKEELQSYKQQAVALERRRRRQVEAKRTRELQDLRRKASAKARRLNEEKRCSLSIQMAWRRCVARKVLYFKRERRKKVEVEAARRRWEISQEYRSAQHVSDATPPSNNTMTVTMAAQGFAMNRATLPPPALSSPTITDTSIGITSGASTCTSTGTLQQQQHPPHQVYKPQTVDSPSPASPHILQEQTGATPFYSPQLSDNGEFTIGQQQQQPQHQQQQQPQQQPRQQWQQQPTSASKRRRRSLQPLTALVLGFRVRLFMRSPKVNTLLKQIRDTDDMLQSIPNNDDPLRQPLMKQLYGIKAQIADLFIPSQRRGSGYRLSFGQVFAEEMGRVHRAKVAMATTSSSTASSSGSSGGSSGGGFPGDRAVSKKSVKRGMTARERTKKYNEELRKRRKQGGDVAAASASSSSSSFSARSSKRKENTAIKPWQTPRNSDKTVSKQAEYEGTAQESQADNSNNNGAAASVNLSGASNRDRVWFDEGGFNLPPVSATKEATAVVFQILSARDLYGVPRAPDPEPGPRDPFVSIEMIVNVPGVGERALHQKSSIKTAVKQSTLNPKWDEDLGLAFSTDSTMKETTKINIRVEDNDRFNKQSFLGCITYVLSFIYPYSYVPICYFNCC